MALTDQDHLEDAGLCDLGNAYYRLGQVDKAIGYLEQAMRIGQEIKNPRIVQTFGPQLEKLRRGGGEKPSGGIFSKLLRKLGLWKGR